VPLETAHKGTTNRWRDVPGCFERHLQRKEGNPLFPASERQPSDDAIERARAKDVADLEKFKAEVNAFLQSGAESLKRMTTVGNMGDFQRTQVIPLLCRVAGLGEVGVGLFKTLEKCRGHLHKAIADAVGGEEGQKLFRSFEELEERSRFQYNLFLAQASREDTPIPAAYLPALLSESFDTIKEYIEGLYSHDPEDAKHLANEALVLLNEVAQEGFELNGAEVKLGLLEEYATKPAAS
jgi:hypothetical protein